MMNIGWASCPLGHLLVPKNDKAKQVKSTEYATVGTYPVVDQSADFICGYHDDTQKVIADNLPLTVFGDHTRHTKYISFPFIAGADGTQLLKAKQEIEDKFFYYLVSQAAEQIGNFGYDRHFKHLKEYVCNYPTSKPEQSKIAEILSTVDRAIEQTEALIAKQQRIKTGLLQDLLTRGIDEHGNLRSEHIHEFKDSPLGRIPLEWEARELRTYLTYLSYGFTNPMPEAKDGPYMVTAANVTNGVVEYDYCRRTTVEAYDKLLTKKSRPEIGDILITKDGTLGRLAIVDRLPLCINQSVAVMRPKHEVDNIYLKLLLESPECQKRILDDSGGSTIKHIYISKIDKMVIGVPKEKTEQRAIKERLLSQYGLLYQYEWNHKKLRALKTALMQDLLTGKKRVTALLTRVKVNDNGRSGD